MNLMERVEFIGKRTLSFECKNFSKFSKIFGNYFNYLYLCSQIIN